MKAFLHIGTEKTGTTTLQNFLANNRQNLLDNNYLYPNTPGKTNHIKLPILASDSKKFPNMHKAWKLYSTEKIDKFTTEFMEGLEQELTLSNCENVVFSSEHCSSRLIAEEEIQNLKSLLNNFVEDIEVIIYLRRQDKFLASTYSTAIRAGHTYQFSIPSQKSIETRYNYYNILNKFAKVFGKNKITVRIFESSQMIEGDLIKDFTHTIGLKTDDSYTSVPNLNTSLDVYSLEYTRLLNKNLKKFIKHEPNKYISQIIKRLEVYSNQYKKKRTILLSEKIAREFMSIFDKSNQKVAKEYLNRPDGKLFSDDFTGLRQQDISGITMKLKLLEITAFLFKDKLINPS